MAMKKYLYPFLILFLFTSPAMSETLYNLSSDWKLSLQNHTRVSGNFLGNNLDLNSDKSDGVAFMGFAYDMKLTTEYKDIFSSFFKLESNGPFDYDAPVLSDRKVNTISGQVDNYRFPEIIPRVEEYWVDTRVFSFPVKFKVGQYPYQVGNGYALGGYYENYGASIYSTSENFKWTVYYYKPDIVNKIVLGPQTPQEKDQGYAYDSNAHFLSLDIMVQWNGFSFQPYVGMVRDTTPADHRDNIYPYPVNEDNLGTVGIDVNKDIDKLNIGIEVAKNFGSANVTGNNSDIIHKGYMAHADVSYAFEKITPRSKMLISSGSKVDESDVLNGRISSHSNNSFSVYSPANSNLFDTVYPSAQGPYVATGAGYAINYGVLRPGAFGDPYQLNNLIMPNLGMGFSASDKWTISLDYWYLRSYERPIGALDNRAIKLSSDLGHEVDFSTDYKLTEHITLNFLAGVFIPGKYYREKRDDGDALGLVPSPRFDGDADPAYQFEFGTEITF